MPRYEFECPDCGHVFDLNRPMSKSGDPANCPNDGAAAHRLFSAGAIAQPRVKRKIPVDLDRRAERAQRADEAADAAGAPRAPGDDTPIAKPK